MSKVRWGAIPLSDDGREMMGTHGSVTVNGEHVLSHVVSGEYVSKENFIRFAIKPYGTPGVTYAIFRGGFRSDCPRVGTFTVPK